MSAPRPIVPGKTYLLTRRCTQRQFWLRPSVLVVNIFIYCLAVAARRFGIEVHAACVLSNHWHAVVTDVRGQLPRFLHWMHEYTSNCINTFYDRGENMWSNAAPSWQELCDDESTLREIVYCLKNPVESELVPRSRDWPGFVTTPRDLAGGRYEAARPPVFFRANGPTPARASVAIARPPIYPELSDEAVAALVAAELQRAEREIRRRVRARGGRFLGVEAVLQQRPSDAPTTAEPRRQRRPRVVAATRRVRDAALDRHRLFEEAHHDCRLAFAAGDRDIEFPAGTWAMARVAGVRVAALDSS